MFFTNLCERFISSRYGEFGVSCFWTFWFLLCALCMLEVLDLVFHLLVCTRLWSCWCAFFGSRPLGVDQLGHYLLDHWEESMAVHNTTKNLGDEMCFCWGHFLSWEPYMLALVGQPSLRGYYACMVLWKKGGTLEKLQAKKM